MVLKLGVTALTQPVIAYRLATIVFVAVKYVCAMKPFKYFNNTSTKFNIEYSILANVKKLKFRNVT